MSDIQFRPKARPVDTVGVQTRMQEGVRPVGPVRDLAPNMGQLPEAPAKSNTDQLVTALAGFSRNLGTFLTDRLEKKNTEDGSEAELRAIRDNATSWGDAVRNDPSLADKSPYFRQMYESRAARNRVQASALGMVAEYSKSPIAGSDDPTAISAWLSERWKPVIDSASTPAEREAMLEEVQRTSKQFLTVHTTNSRANLVYKNTAAYGAAVDGHFNEAAVKGGTGAFKTNDPVSKDLQPHEAALLNGIAGGESAGKYNVRYTPAGGANFELTSDHPRMKEVIPNGPNAGRTSDASGRYQFLSSTWDGLPAAAKGDGRFTPENQDKAALWYARKHYKDKTGEDLDTALKAEGLSPRIQGVLAAKWQAFEGNSGKHAATFKATADRYAAGGGGDASGSYTLARVIQREEAAGRVQGMSQADIDTRTVEAASSAALRFRDPSYLDIPLRPRPDGSPGAGNVPGYRDKLDQVRKQLLTLSVKEDDEAYKRQEREKDRASAKATQYISDTLYDALEKGNTVTLSPKTLATVNKLYGQETADKVVKIQKSLSDFQGQEDSGDVIRLEIEANESRLSDADLHKAIESGTLRNPETIRRLLKTNRDNRESSLLADKTVVDILQDTSKLLGERSDFGILKHPELAQKGVDALRRSVLQYEKNNKDKPRSEVLSWLMDEQRKVIGYYAPKHKYNATPDYDGSTPTMPTPAKGGVTSPGANAPAPAATTPPRASPAVAPAPAPAKPATASRIEPSAAVDWRTTPVYESREALEADYLNRRKPESSMSKWAAAKGFKSPEEIKEFLTAQRALLSGRTGK